MPPLHIVCWNVASWPTTLAEIRTHHTSLAAWLDRHQVDILALQEVKGSEAKLAEKPSAYGASPQDAPEFDSFFALASRDYEKAGFNGVAVFARKGLTKRANPRPLGVAWLDDQGRCIETDHEHFVLINIYAPHEGAFAEKLAEKMSFLLHVQRRVDELHALGRKVILVGDFNLKIRMQDVEVSERCVHLPSLINTPLQPNDPDIVVRIRNSLEGDGLETFSLALAKLEAKPFKEKYRMFLRNVHTNEDVRINPGSLWTMDCVKGAYHQFRLGQTEVPVALKDPMPLDSSIPGLVSNGRNGGQAWISNAANVMRLGELCTAVVAIFGGQAASESDLEQLSDWADRNELLRTGTRPCIEYMGRSLVTPPRSLVDVFAKFFGHVKSRWTVFGQYTNERYSNSGNKIDYILVDADIEGCLVPPSRPLPGCTNHLLCTDPACASDASCALRACTANGLWKAAPFEGGGIPDAPPVAYEHQFRNPAKEPGIIYTPPSYSDHLAVTAVLDLPLLNLVIEKDAATRAARPHARQKTLDMFFKPVAGSASAELAEEQVDSSPSNGAPAAKRPRSIKDFFSRA